MPWSSCGPPGFERLAGSCVRRPSPCHIGPALRQYPLSLPPSRPHRSAPKWVHVGHYATAGEQAQRIEQYTQTELHYPDCKDNNEGCQGWASSGAAGRRVWGVWGVAGAGQEESKRGGFRCWAKASSQHLRGNALPCCSLPRQDAYKPVITGWSTKEPLLPTSCLPSGCCNAQAPAPVPLPAGECDKNPSFMVGTKEAPGQCIKACNRLAAAPGCHAQQTQRFLAPWCGVCCHALLASMPARQYPPCPLCPWHCKFACICLLAGTVQVRRLFRVQGRLSVTRGWV